MFSQYDYLYEYLVIYREGGLKGASEVLHMSTSSLSKHLSALESSLGFKLLERGRHIFEPTDMGFEVWNAAYTMLDIQDSLESLVTKSSALFVYPMVSNPEFYSKVCLAARAFSETHENANIVIDQESIFKSPFSAMENGKINVLGYDVYSTPRFEENIFSKEVGEQHFQAVVTLNNPLACYDSVTASQLAECTLSQLKGSSALLYYTWRALNQSFVEKKLKVKYRDRKIFMPAEAAMVPLDDDEAYILYKDSETIRSMTQREGLKILDVEDIVHPIAMACRADNERAIEFILSL